MKKNKRINILLHIIAITISFFSVSRIVNAEVNNVAKIENTLYSSISEALDNAKKGDTITLIADINENQTINVNVGVIIEGNNHTITSTLTGIEATFIINTSSEIIINNVNIETNTRGIAINNSVHNITLNNSNINSGQRGITVNSNSNHDSILNVNNCIIKKSGITNYDEEVINDYSRGISIWEYQASTVSLKNTTIQGFAYDINITANNPNYDASKTKIIIDNCILKGRAGINDSNTLGLNIEIKDSEILGINNQAKGTSERFGNIVVERTSTVILNIENTKLMNYQNEGGQANPSALQYLLDIRTNGNIINMSGNTEAIDTTNKINNIIFLYPNNKNDIKITGGNYSYDVSDYLPEEYECVLVNNLYHVQKKFIPSDPIVELKELDLTTSVTKPIIGTINISDSVKLILDTLKTTDEINNINNKNIKVTIDMNDITPSKSIEAEFKNNIKIENVVFTNYYDISINVIDLDSDTIIGKITKLNNKIRFAIILPQELQNIKEGYQRTYYIMRKHNNKYDLIETELSNDGSYLTFENDEFSIYALAYVDKEIIKDEVKPEEIENPKTYDSIITDITIFGISFIGMVAGGLYLKAKKSNIIQLNNHKSKL